MAFRDIIPIETDSDNSKFNSILNSLGFSNNSSIVNNQNSLVGYKPSDSSFFADLQLNQYLAESDLPAVSALSQAQSTLNEYFMVASKQVERITDMANFMKIRLNIFKSNVQMQLNNVINKKNILNTIKDNIKTYKNSEWDWIFPFDIDLDIDFSLEDFTFSVFEITLNDDYAGYKVIQIITEIYNYFVSMHSLLDSLTNFFTVFKDEIENLINDIQDYILSEISESNYDDYGSIFEKYGL